MQFFQKISEKMRDESSNMKSRIQEDIRRAVSVKASEEATWKGIKVFLCHQDFWFCGSEEGLRSEYLFKTGRLKEKTQDMSYKGGLGCLLQGGEPSQI